MPYASVRSACLSGIGVLPVTVEVDIQPGLPLFTIIGLPDKAVDEARQRVRSALRNSGFSLPLGRVTVNLFPATVRKQGAGLDLAIAIGVLAAIGKVRRPEAGVWIIGELSLSGTVVPVPALPALLIEAYKRGVLGAIVPGQNEASRVYECATRPVLSLAEAIQINQSPLIFKATSRVSQQNKAKRKGAYAIDLVYGQEEARRVLLVALAGGHNLLLTGPPGSGKTMLARAAAELLPLPARSLELEMIQLAILAGEELPEGSCPFRSPHHTVSHAALLGGGITGRPGLLSLAHGGILFLDEFPEFSREVRETLRQPLQDKIIRLNRQGREYAYPADCLVIAAQNHCPCGLRGAEAGDCRCLPRDLARYGRALSEPLLERFELFCDVPKIAYSEWSQKKRGISGADMAKAIKSVRDGSDNANVSFTSEARSVLEKAAQVLSLSARVLQSLSKVAKTIACLEGCGQIAAQHIQEALHYRNRSVAQ